MSEKIPFESEVSRPEDQKKIKIIMELIDRILDMIETDDFEPAKLEKIKSGYECLSNDGKSLFFLELLKKVETSKEEIEGLLRDALALEEGDIQWNKILSELHSKSESPRMKLFRSFLNISGGLNFLLDLRTNILSIQRKTAGDLSPLDQELSHLFTSWFQNGFLFLQEVTFDSSYRQINFIKQNDMVHPMMSLDEMWQRLGHDRRCFSLYHRIMPEEPVVFIEVALTKGIAKSIHPIISEHAEPEGEIGQFDTAMFYSINNTQNGLAGIGLGKVLVFQVVDYIKRTVPQVQTFSTLSPVPGLWKRYFKKILEDNGKNFQLTKDKLIEVFPQKSRKALEQEFTLKTGSQEKDFGKVLLGILSDSKWIENPVYVKYLEKPLVDITYFYIINEKNPLGKPLNPVANFHMSNGAKVSKNNINFLGNRSARGMDESCGMMVNYIYSQSWFQQIRSSFKSFLGIER